jgi:beta-phosphoglucomutase-like phosphatase (HAD superfamily)
VADPKGGRRGVEEFDARILGLIIAGATVAAQILWRAASALGPERSQLTREEAAMLRETRQTVRELVASRQADQRETEAVRRMLEAGLQVQAQKLDAVAELLRLILAELRRDGRGGRGGD